MIPFIIASIPIEVEPYQEYHPNEWVEKGHATTSGLVSYYKAYYNK